MDIPLVPLESDSAASGEVPVLAMREFPPVWTHSRSGTRIQCCLLLAPSLVVATDTPSS